MCLVAEQDTQTKPVPLERAQSETNAVVQGRGTSFGSGVSRGEKLWEQPGFSSPLGSFCLFFNIFLRTCKVDVHG